MKAFAYFALLGVLIGVIAAGLAGAFHHAGAADDSPWHEISTPNKVEFSIWTKCVVLRGTPYRIFIEHDNRDQFFVDQNCLEAPR